MVSDSQIIGQTTKWIRQIVIKNNFCPFAAREMDNAGIHFQISRALEEKDHLHQLSLEFQRLHSQEAIGTSFLIFPDAYADFLSFLSFLERGQRLLEKENYEGIFQLASFHPDYCFANAPADDPANYTNRSPYPMIHLLREDSVEKALKHFPHPEQIPERNMALARKKGLATMKEERQDCFRIEPGEN